MALKKLLTCDNDFILKHLIGQILNIKHAIGHFEKKSRPMLSCIIIQNILLYVVNVMSPLFQLFCNA